MEACGYDIGRETIPFFLSFLNKRKGKKQHQFYGLSLKMKI